jgi:hypothetical protein
MAVALKERKLMENEAFQCMVDSSKIYGYESLILNNIIVLLLALLVLLVLLDDMVAIVVVGDNIVTNSFDDSAPYFVYYRC